MLLLKVFFILFPIPLFVVIFMRVLIAIKAKRQRNANKKKVIAFMHPYCASGGGGERVLWCALRSLQHHFPHYHYVVYTGDVEYTHEEMMHKVTNNFKITLKSSVELVHLHRRKWVEARLYPYFTLLGQSLGSLLMAWEAINKIVPHVYIDSMGYSFTLPLFKWIGGCKVASYVHYPTISTDMLGVVSGGKESFNNRAFIKNSRILTYAKLLYYHLFACLYGLVGRASDVVMVNSSWTERHIRHLWKCDPSIVFPPCNTTEFQELALTGRNKFHIVSIGQIRPEKNHSFQLQIFKDFINRLPNNDSQIAKLTLIGSCRNAEDEERVKQLRELAAHLNIQNQVEFKLNVSFKELKDEMQKANIGLHTMINEHFGIGVVECLAAGLITLSHDSGGPQMDIIQSKTTGFLASDLKSFSDALMNIINLNDRQHEEIQLKARESVERFSEAEFDTNFLQSIINIL